jgi:hypothetical protein
MGPLPAAEYPLGAISGFIGRFATYNSAPSGTPAMLIVAVHADMASILQDIMAIFKRDSRGVNEFASYLCHKNRRCIRGTYN